MAVDAQGKRFASQHHTGELAAVALRTGQWLFVCGRGSCGHGVERVRLDHSIVGYARVASGWTVPAGLSGKSFWPAAFWRSYEHLPRIPAGSLCGGE